MLLVRTPFQGDQGRNYTGLFGNYFSLLPLTYKKALILHLRMSLSTSAAASATKITSDSEAAANVRNALFFRITYSYIKPTVVTAFHESYN
jgi:hypothetical protein